MMGGDGFGMVWPWLFGLLLTIGVILLIVLAIRSIGGGIRNDRTQSGAANTDGAPTQHGRARGILGERYARGELTTEEYQERLRNLGDG